MTGRGLADLEGDPAPDGFGCGLMVMVGRRCPGWFGARSSLNQKGLDRLTLVPVSPLKAKEDPLEALQILAGAQKKPTIP